MTLNYTDLFIKFFLGMFTLIFQINLFGKSNIAPTNAMDQLQNYVLGGIMGGIIYNPNITILQFLLVLIIWTLVVFILKFARDNSAKFRNLINGRPVQVIKNGHVLVDNCMKAGLSANDLMFKLRSQNVFSVEQVKNCVFEQNGQLTVIENDEANIRFPLISDGSVNVDVLELIHHSQDWLDQQVQAAGFNDVDEIFLGEYVNHKVHLIGYSNKGR